MATISIQVLEIPHGHGLSFKKGVADGLLECRDRQGSIHKTHAASYERGRKVGDEMRHKFAELVK